MVTVEFKCHNHDPPKSRARTLATRTAAFPSRQPSRKPLFAPGAKNQHELNSQSSRRPERTDCQVKLILLGARCSSSWPPSTSASGWHGTFRGELRRRTFRRHGVAQPGVGRSSSPFQRCTFFWTIFLSAAQAATRPDVDFIVANNPPNPSSPVHAPHANPHCDSASQTRAT